MRRALPALIALVVLLPAIGGAQTVDQSIQPELRVDAIITQQLSVLEAGGGFQIPAGYYARIGVTGAAGTELANGTRNASGRVDVIGRFLFDPFRQSKWGLSAGAGVSVRAHSGDRVRPYLVTVIDLEGPHAASGVAPAVQVGLGGGVRVGAAIRWAGRGAR